MQQVFIIKNHDNHVLSKKSEWVSGWHLQHIFRSEERDVVLNTLLEANARDVTQRLVIVAIDTDEQGKLILPEGIDMTPYEVVVNPFEARRRSKPSDLEEAASA